MEMAAEKDSGCETPEWKWQRRRISGVTPGWWNVVMGSLKDRLGLYGYRDLGEWF